MQGLPVELSPSCMGRQLCDSQPFSPSSVSYVRSGATAGEMGNILRADVDPGHGEGLQAPPAVDKWPRPRYGDLGGSV